MTGWFWVRILLRQLRFGTLAIPFTPLCQCVSEETLKAVGPFYFYLSFSGYGPGLEDMSGCVYLVTVQRKTLPCTKHGRRRIVLVSSADQCKMAAMRDFARPLRLHKLFPCINTEIESLKELTVTVTLTVPLTLTPNHIISVTIP